MAFLGRPVQTLKSAIRSRKALIVLAKASDIEAAIPADQNTKAMSIARDKLLFFGLGEQETVSAPTENGETVSDHDGNEIVLDKVLNGEMTVLGTFENDDIDDIEDEAWSIFTCDPKTVYAMTGYASSAASMAAVTAGQTFVAHEIFHNVKISGNTPNEYGTAQRTAFTFTKELETNSDSKFKGITITLLT